MYSITKNNRIDAFHTIITAIDPKQPVCILYDDDADGMCSAVSLYTLLQRKGFTTIHTYAKFSERHFFSLTFIEELARKGISTVFCVDFEPLSWKMITRSQLQTLPFTCVIIDHHFDMTDEYQSIQSSSNILYLHPKNCSNCDNPSQYCCSKFVFDICSLFEDLSDIEWKIIPGMIGDMNILQWPQYIRDVAKKYSHPIDTKPESFFQSPFGQFSRITAFSAKKGFEHFEACFQSYLHCSSVEEMLSLGSDFEKEKQTVDYFLQQWRDHVEFTDKRFFIIHLPDDTGMTSLLSSIISYFEQDKVFVFYQFNTEQQAYHISLRSQKTSIHLGEIAQSIAFKLTDANGGGHKPAAGLLCQKNDIQKCITLLKEAFTE